MTFPATEPAAAPPPAPAVRPIAHWTHTLALVFVLTLTTVAGRMRAADSVVHSEPHLARYVSTILIEWLLLGSVIAGVYHRELFFRTTLGRRRYSLATALSGGVPVYLAGLVAIAVVGLSLWHTPLHGKTDPAVVLALMPHTALEAVAWFAVSLTAGITEELIFRGYLLQQLTAWTRSPYVAVVLSALLFGSVHLYEGFAAILPLAALAVVYGLLVVRLRGDLRTVIVAHTLQDAMVPVLLLVHNHLLQFQQTHPA